MPNGIHVHEEWKYDTRGDPAVASIRKLVLQCDLCHGCEHFFRAEKLAWLGDLVERGLAETRRPATSPQQLQDLIEQGSDTGEQVDAIRVVN